MEIHKGYEYTQGVKIKLSKQVREQFKKAGSIGGHKRKRNLTPAQRKKLARKAIEARWAKHKKDKAET